MSEAEIKGGRDETRLDEAILYLLVKEAKEKRTDGYKIPISKVHEVLFSIGDELVTEVDTPLKFNQNGPQIHSPQVEDALSDVVPYTIPVRNPSFSLEISEDVADVAFSSIQERIPEEKQEKLDELFEDPDFRSSIEEQARAL